MFSLIFILFFCRLNSARALVTDINTNISPSAFFSMLICVALAMTAGPQFPRLFVLLLFTLQPKLAAVAYSFASASLP